jgi:putative multiple sugar transport system permease protein
VQVIRGLVLLFAVALDVYNKNQGRSSITGMLMSKFRGPTAPVASTALAERPEELTAEAEPRS